VRSAAWYVLEAWGHQDDWTITESLQASMKLLANAQKANELL
jgi:hypothetical protein